MTPNLKRAKIIWEKGTKRDAFWKGEVNKYGWVDVGSSFLPSEIIAAFLWAQLENLDDIQKKGNEIWNSYWQGLKTWANAAHIQLPFIPDHASNNGHLFYLVYKNLRQRMVLINKLKENDILAVCHYLSLHKSPFFQGKHDSRELPESNRYADCLVRLPKYYELRTSEIELLIKCILVT